MSGLQISMKIDGLDDFARRVGDPAVFTSEMKSAEKDALTAIRDEAKGNAASFSSVLPQSVQFEVRGDGLSGVIGSVAKTALSIEQGRRAGEAPPYESIERWLTHRGTGAAQMVKTRRYVRPRKSSSAADVLRGEAVVIMRRINATGTKPLPFIVPAAHSSLDKVKRRFEDAVQRSLKRLVSH